MDIPEFTEDFRRIEAWSKQPDILGVFFFFNFLFNLSYHTSSQGLSSGERRMYELTIFKPGVMGSIGLIKPTWMIISGQIGEKRDK